MAIRMSKNKIQQPLKPKAMSTTINVKKLGLAFGLTGALLYLEAGVGIVETFIISWLVGVCESGIYKVVFYNSLKNKFKKWWYNLFITIGKDFFQLNHAVYNTKKLGWIFIRKKQIL